MRYYNIEIRNPGSTDLLLQFTSHPNGVNSPADPGALNIELDLPVQPYAAPGSDGAYARVWGIPLAFIAQAKRLGITTSNPQGKTIKIFGGMGKGLPLAKPSQSGLLVQGMIFQAFANWVATAMTLEFSIVPGSSGTGTLDSPVNLPFSWQRGTPLSGAIDTALSTGFPKYQRSIHISDKLVTDHDEAGTYGTLGDFAQSMSRISKDILKGTYAGVQIMLQNDTIIVSDTPTSFNSSTSKKIDFQDMIGQPTWIGFSEVQLSLVMRADINVGDFINLPQSLAFTTAQSTAAMRQSSTFTGIFQVIALRHVGNLRSPEGMAWVTVVNCAGPFDKQGNAINV